MKNIKAIIFDLDNTLHDTERLTELGLKEAINIMIKKGLNCSPKEALERIKQIIQETPSKNKFEELSRIFESNTQNTTQEIAKSGEKKYCNFNFEKVYPYPYLIETLRELQKNYKLILITKGTRDQQKRKIGLLKINNFFDYIFIEEKVGKEKYFLEALKLLNIDSKKILIIGDRIDKEIKIANKLGMKTIRIDKGKYKNLKPLNENEIPKYTIENLKDIFKILEKENNSKKSPKIVTIGGGTGTGALLEGLKYYTENITTIVTVTDSGRSTGKLRKDLNMLAPGDTRNCLIALANSEKLMCDLFQYRFKNGDLEGYSLGNLFIGALTKLTGSFEKAIEEASKILKLKGKVCPVTFDNINICAELEDGTILNEEDEIIDRHNPEVYSRSPIKRVYHNPKPIANSNAVKEIEQADLIVISPGSLFTSITSNLLVSGISEACKKSKAKKVYVCNIMTQQCQTTGYKATNHIKQISKYLGFTPDHILINNKKPKSELIDSYEKEHAKIVEIDRQELESLEINIIEEDLLDKSAEKKPLWEKKDLLRHSPEKTAKLLMTLINIPVINKPNEITVTQKITNPSHQHL